MRAAVRCDVPLARLHTFHLGVKARHYAEARSAEELESLLAQRGASDRLLLLGRGANLLFRGDFDGLVVRVLLEGRRVVSEDAESVVLDVAAGEDWPRLVADCAARGWGGIENLALIPGTVGAAPVQHIAAYGHNLKDVVVSVEALAIEGGARRVFTNAECGFGYRESAFRRELRGRYAITGVRLRLAKVPALATSYRSRDESLEGELAAFATPPWGVADVYRAVVRIRRRKLPDPKHVGTAGSFFKNPVVTRAHYEELLRLCPGLQAYPAGARLAYAAAGPSEAPEDEALKVPAGWLIDRLGWKGKRVGRCGVWPRQALTVVNYGGAAPSEVLELVEAIRASVAERYGVALEDEVEVV